MNEVLLRPNPLNPFNPWLIQTLLSWKFQVLDREAFFPVGFSGGQFYRSRNRIGMLDGDCAELRLSTDHDEFTAFGLKVELVSAAQSDFQLERLTFPVS